VTKFGLLEYRDTGNLGDEIQSIAAAGLLPRVDDYINRDDLGGYAPPDGDPVALIVHGWFAHTPETWPPSPAIRPLLISMHLSAAPGFGPSGLSAREFFLAAPMLDYLKFHAPVGARDAATAALLERAGVESYFSGCVSLTLPPRAVPRGDAIVLNDAPGEITAHIRARTRRPVVLTTHMDRAIAGRAARFARAEALLDIYAGAHCVVTTRLHCALPCLALGTPVLLLDVAPDRARFSGLEGFYRHCAPEAFVAGASGFDLEAPAPNRDDFRKLAAMLRARVVQFAAAAERGTLAAPPMDAETVAAARRDTLIAFLAEARANEAALRRALAEKEREIARLGERPAEAPGAKPGGGAARWLKPLLHPGRRG
jgi:hypothetical protein